MDYNGFRNFRKEKSLYIYTKQTAKINKTDEVFLFLHLWKLMKRKTTQRNKGIYWIGNGLKQTFENQNGRWFCGQLILTRKSTNQSIGKKMNKEYTVSSQKVIWTANKNLWKYLLTQNLSRSYKLNQ